MGLAGLRPLSGLPETRSLKFEFKIIRYVGVSARFFTWKYRYFSPGLRRSALRGLSPSAIGFAWSKELCFFFGIKVQVWFQFYCSAEDSNCALDITRSRQISACLDEAGMDR